MGLNKFEHDQNNLMMGLYYDDYGLIYFTFWTHVFPMMACPMGMLIRLWDK